MAVEVRKEVPTVEEEREESRGEAMGKDGWVVVAIHLSVSVRWIGVGVRADLLKRQFNMFLKGGKKTIKHLDILFQDYLNPSVAVVRRHNPGWIFVANKCNFWPTICRICRKGDKYEVYVCTCIAQTQSRLIRLTSNASCSPASVSNHFHGLLLFDGCFIIINSSRVAQYWIFESGIGATKGLATGAEQGPLELNKNNGNGNMAFWTQQPWIVSSGSKKYFECLRLDANCATLILIITVSITEMLELDSACHWAISSNP